MRALALRADTAPPACIATDTPTVDAIVARARAGWPRGLAAFARVPVAGRWSHTAEAVRAEEPGRVALWRGSSHVADDARAVGLAYARLVKPVGLTLLEVDERGEFGAFADDLEVRARILAADTPATAAAVDAADGGAPWLTLTLAAILDTARLLVILPPGADDWAAATPPGSALAAVLASYDGPIAGHAVG